MTASHDGVAAPAARRTVRRVGERALLVECADLAEVHGLHAALEATPMPGQGEVLPAARTVLVHLADPGPGTARRLADALAVLPVRPSSASTGREIVLDTVYNGDDLAAVADTLGTSVEGVVEAHAAHAWTAAFLGFAPGFAYLERDGPPLDVPRRGTPRTSVAAGAVALAGPYSAVYPRVSPGGWQLVGRTSAVMWDLGRDEPALVRAGDRVRFRPVRAVAHLAPEPVRPGTAPTGPSATPQGPPAPAGDAAVPRPALEVVHPGGHSLMEDLGRPGHAARGVGRSGAADRGAAVRANRLVGNPRGAAVVEAVLGGLALRAHGPVVVAVTGAAGDLLVERAPDRPAGVPAERPTGGPPERPTGVPADRPDHRPLQSRRPPGTPFALHDGETLVVGPPAAGLRSYVAVRGGFGVEPVLGSRSSDVLSGLGPPPLARGDVLPVGPPPPDAVAAWPDPPSAPAPGPVEVRVVPGPRDDWLTDEGRQRLASTEWLVTPASNRVGLRLAGEPLPRAVHGELPSEGVVAGAVQVPPSGQPVVFLADHPVTGGYPVVAVVRDADLDALAQVRPGDRVRLVPDPAGRLDA